VLDFINGGAELVAEFTEIESGKHSDRPEPAKSLDACRRQKAKLVIAKLDRLSRNLNLSTRSSLERLCQFRVTLYAEGSRLPAPASKNLRGPSGYRVQPGPAQRRAAT
jgi:DNA invertase Pin-like site-specific DNA recombinase